MLESFCRENDIMFILDEIQANFGRTGSMYAFSEYGIEPDLVALGKGMGNGVPVDAIVGRSDLFGAMGFGAGSDTWSAHPLGCASVIATLEEFETRRHNGSGRRTQPDHRRGSRSPDRTTSRQRRTRRRELFGESSLHLSANRVPMKLPTKSCDGPTSAMTKAKQFTCLGRSLGKSFALHLR